MASIVAIAITIFIIRLLFMRGVTWSGQQRDANALSAAVAARLLLAPNVAWVVIIRVARVEGSRRNSLGVTDANFIDGNDSVRRSHSFASLRKLLAHLRLCSTPENSNHREIAGLSQIFRR